MPQIELYRPFVNKQERIPCLDLTLLYLVQHQSFTGESRSWSRGIELGPRPRMEFHFTSKLHNQAYSEPKRLSLWLTWHHSVTSHPSPPRPPMFFVRALCYLSIWDETAGCSARIWLRLRESDRLESWSLLQSPGRWPGPGFCPSVDPLSAVSDSDTRMRTLTPGDTINSDQGFKNVGSLKSKAKYQSQQSCILNHQKVFFQNDWFDQELFL